MTIYKTVRLPAHIKSVSESIAAPFDSCFVPCGFLFPESREDLQPYREFPLPEPFYSPVKKVEDDSRPVDDFLSPVISDDSMDGNFDSTILQISPMDELLLDVQGMGMQYTLHAQMCLRDDLDYVFPRTWDKNQALMLNIPVFSEELCQWHYPISTMGYNIANTDPPLDIDIAHNFPQLFGFLPNGDLAVYWEIAERLADEFSIEIDPLRCTIDGSLILMPNCAEQIKSLAPCHHVVETGVVINPGKDISAAVSFAQQWLGKRPIVIKNAMYHFYRFRLPVVHCELDFNPYAEATWGAFGYVSPRIASFEFKINNNPFSREVPIFSTEKGNVIVSRTFFDRLKALVKEYGGMFNSQLFPIQRIP